MLELPSSPDRTRRSLLSASQSRAKTATIAETVSCLASAWRFEVFELRMRCPAGECPSGGIEPAPASAAWLKCRDLASLIHAGPIWLRSHGQSRCRAPPAPLENRRSVAEVTMKLNQLCFGL